jgi:LPXTG-motif cell wall-anchored protein
LATGTASATGSITLSANVPGDATVGNHRVSLYAPVSGIGVRMSVTVAAAAGPTPSTPQVNPSTPQVNPSTLPATGSDSDLRALGLLLISTGVVMSTIRRRRAA